MKYGPEHVKAHHVNSIVPAEPNATAHPELYAKVQTTPLSDTEKAGLARSGWFSQEGNGYYRKQATKPQTVGYFMTDSPVGLLAWIYETLHDWTDNYAWTEDEILTWISIYYFSKAGPAATSFIYYDNEHRDPSAFQAAQAYTNVPLGVSRFPQEVILLPKLWNHTMGPIVFEKEHERGGHFAAWERPAAIVNDLRTMFGKDGGAYNLIKGKSGFL